MKMIEKVAEAIRDASDKTGLEYDISELLLAKAAIKAMREPTNKMILTSLYQGCYDSVELWKSMIDAALKE